MKTLVVIAALVVGSLVTGPLHGQTQPTGGQQPGEVLQLSFGVYQSDKATVMYRKFIPVIEAVQDDLEVRLKRPVDIEMRIFKEYDDGLQALVRGTVDFVRFGPASYVLARKCNPRIGLLAMESKKGKKRFKGLVVVRNDSPIRKLADLEGRRFAFGNRNSTIGRYLIQARLLEAGVGANKLGGYAYLGRHDKVFKAVQIGDYDAGALKSGTFKKLNRNHELRVLLSFDNVTKPWIARSGLHPEIQKAIRVTLLAMRDPRALKALKASGFLPASDEDYEMIRHAMKTARGFEEFVK